MLDIKSSRELEELYHRYMTECIELAVDKRNSNYVAACIIYGPDELKISEGWRHFDGRLDIHAEKHALQRAREIPKGSILVTTSEPCVSKRHSNGSRSYGLFEACCNLIVKSGIKLVIKPTYSTESDRSLKERGIDVTCLGEFHSILDNLRH